MGKRQEDMHVGKEGNVDKYYNEYQLGIKPSACQCFGFFNVDECAKSKWSGNILAEIAGCYFMNMD